MAFDFEFLIVDGVVLAFLVYELVSVRRSIRRSREEAARRAAAKEAETRSPSDATSV